METISTELITIIAGIVASIVSGWGSWFFARRKYNSEVDNNVIENMKQSLEFYTKLSDDNKARLEEALKRNEQLEGEIRQLRAQMFELMNNICYDMTCELRARKSKVIRKRKGCEDVIEEGK